MKCLVSIITMRSHSLKRHYIVNPVFCCDEIFLYISSPTIHLC